MVTHLMILPGGHSSTEAEDLLHDMRGALTVIRGQCYAIERPATHIGEIIDRVHTIDAEVDRILQSITRVRSVVAGDDYGQPLDNVDMGALLADVADRFDGSASAGGVALRVECPREAVFVVGYEPDLRRMLDNLVTNAIRHAPNDSDVQVDLIQRDDRVIVRVRDHGVGVPESDADRIFARGATSAADVGWGIGLPIAQQIARRHHGTVAVHPTVAGAVFAVDLPVVVAAPQVTA